MTYGKPGANSTTEELPAVTATKSKDGRSGADSQRQREATPKPGVGRQSEVVENTGGRLVLEATLRCRLCGHTLITREFDGDTDRKVIDGIQALMQDLIDTHKC